MPVNFFFLSYTLQGISNWDSSAFSTVPYARSVNGFINGLDVLINEKGARFIEWESRRLLPRQLGRFE